MNLRIIDDKAINDIAYFDSAYGAVFNDEHGYQVVYTEADPGRIEVEVSFECRVLMLRVYPGPLEKVMEFMEEKILPILLKGGTVRRVYVQ